MNDVKAKAGKTQVVVPVDELRTLTRTAFEKAGLTAEDATRVAEILVLADLQGIATHGTRRLSPYVDRVRRKASKARPNIAVTRKSPSLAIVDADAALGPLAARKALDTAIGVARETGVAYVGCRNSNHFGGNAPYGLLACRESMILFSGTNAGAQIAPWGGTQKAVGNNPMGIAAPRRDGPHFILDFAMSIVARGKIRRARELGEPIPLGWGVDPDGQPTTDAAKALEGFVLPIGGHKGYGLALAVDLLAGVLTGSAFGNRIKSMYDHPDETSGVGHFFIVIDPAQAIGLDAYYAQMEAFCALIKAVPPADPKQPVLLPGDLEAQSYDEKMKSGVSMDESQYRTIIGLAEGTGESKIPDA